MAEVHALRRSGRLRVSSAMPSLSTEYRTSSTAGSLASGTAAMALQAELLREQLAVVRGRAEQHLARLRALEIQVRRMLPGEADPAVHLDIVGGYVQVG